MENQHRLIKGYRELDVEELQKMNAVKNVGLALEQMVDDLHNDPSCDQRWVSIGATDLQTGLMALTRAIAKPTFFALMLFILGGCISPYHVPGTEDQFLVTKHAEIRSPFGTNGGFDFLESCKGPSKVVLFYFEADFTDCKPAVLSGEIVSHKYSQGQGGQVVSGLMNAAALGGVAAAAGSAGSAVSSSSATVINNLSVRGHGHK